jgi:hypothetical protein
VERAVLPPAPVHVSVYVRVAVSVPVDCDPLSAFAPDHPPEALQLVAFVDDHVSVDDCPDGMEAGFAANDTVGALGEEVTVTVTL